MAESRAHRSPISSSSGFEGVNAHERVKEENDEGKKLPHHRHEDTHGLRDDIDVDTPIRDVKAPNLFERAKEEIEAVVHAIHPKKEAEAESHGESRDSARKIEFKPENPDSHLEKNSKSPNLIERAKEDTEALIHKKKSAHHHHKETHGTSDDIDEDTPISKIKGPNVFERAKEEIEAIFYAVHPKKDSGNVISSPKKEGGFKASIGRGLEKICSPGSHNRE